MSIRLKTVIGVALIEAVLLAILIFTVMKFMHDSAEEALLKRAYSTAALFTSTAKDPVLAYDLASLDTFSKELNSNPDIEYVRTRTTDGIVLSSAGNANAIDRPFIADKNLKSVSDGIFDTTASISESGVIYAVVEIGFNIARIEATLSETRRLTTFIAVVEMVLVAIFSLLLGTYLTRQLVVLQAAAKSISEGEYTQRLKINSRDEVGEVAIAFNHMSSALQEAQAARTQFEKELIELNKTLEARVDQRTQKINDQMEEIKVAHAKLADAQSKLLQTEKLASIGQLSAGIAHEINNPIAFINSNVKSLREYIVLYQSLFALYRSTMSTDIASSEQIKIQKQIELLEKEEDIEFINEDITSLIVDTVDGTNRVQRIIQGLKDFSHVSSDTKSPCDVVDCIESSLKIVKSNLAETCVVEKHLHAVPAVLAINSELNQVITNILVNAGQAVESNGLVVVETSVEGDDVVVSISDNGAGISDDSMKKLFDPFYTTKPIGIGTGLGLAISYGIIQDHGGTIKVKSKPGIGTTFSIILPIHLETVNANVTNTGAMNLEAMESESKGAKAA